MRTCLFRSSDPVIGGGAGREKFECPGGSLEGTRPEEGDTGRSAADMTTDGTFERGLESVSSFQSFP